MNQQTKSSIPNEAPGRNAPCPCGSGKKYKLCCCPPFLRKSSVDEAQQKPQVDEDAVIVCMPTRGSVSHETLTCLEMNTNGLVKGMIRCARKPVVEARNLLAKTALEVVANPSWPFTPREAFVLWLDDDAWMPPGLLDNMVKCLREPAMQQCDALFAWFSTRMPYSAPVAYRRLDDPESFPKIGVDCQHGDVVQVEMAGFHCVLMRLHAGSPHVLRLSETGGRKLIKGVPAIYGLLGDGETPNAVWDKARCDSALVQRFRALPLGRYTDPRMLPFVPTAKFWQVLEHHTRERTEMAMIPIAA